MPTPTGPASRPALLIGTRKGAFILTADADRQHWTLGAPHFLGHVIHHVVQDPRDPAVILVAAKTGHLGPTVFRSTDAGASWTEAATPPAFAKAGEGEKGRSVDAVFWLTPGHASRPGHWYAGTSPHGMFESDDGGVTWRGVAGYNVGVLTDPALNKYVDTPGSPVGPITHSIRVDPRDARHLYVGMSSGGIFESRDAGAVWKPLNRGVAADYLPEPDPIAGHDPHCVVLAPSDPDRLWQQNHCGIYRLDRPGEVWERIGKAMPTDVGDIGFAIVAHPRDRDTAWVLPMDGSTVWPRTSPGGRPAVYRTSDAGASWTRQDNGLPRPAWLTSYRQGFCADAGDPVGLCFGTSSGELWASRDAGLTWRQLAAHLPAVVSVTAAVL